MELRDLVTLSQKEIKIAIEEELLKNDYKCFNGDGFLYAEPARHRIPILLVAHMDTVHKNKIKTIYISLDGTKMMSPEGIGGDDRCGIYAILDIIKTHKCPVLFCEDEEIGAIGASKFIKQFTSLNQSVKYIIELDRAGFDDCVFYGCDNPKFEKYINSFGWKTQIGSFSDITVLAPALETAAVNLSIGYYQEHTLSEYIRLDKLSIIIERVKNLIDDWENARPYEFIGRTYFSNNSFFPSFYFPLHNGEYIELDGEKYSSDIYNLFIGEDDDAAYIPVRENSYELIADCVYNADGTIRIVNGRDYSDYFCNGYYM